MENRIVSGLDTLDTCRSVDMCDRRQHLFPLFADVGNTTHEGSHILHPTLGENEPPFHIFRKTGGGKRAKFFAKIDFSIYALSHIPLSRGGNDKPGAEGPRAVLKKPLEPAAHPTPHDQVP